jgi:hypothetical protein
MTDNLRNVLPKYGRFLPKHPINAFKYNSGAERELVV